jgi:rubredoxin
MKQDQQTTDIEQAFIERLETHLQGHGIDTSDWDGEDDPAYIIATCFRSLLDNKKCPDCKLRQDERDVALIHAKVEKLTDEQVNERLAEMDTQWHDAIRKTTHPMDRRSMLMDIIFVSRP